MSAGLEPAYQSAHAKPPWLYSRSPLVFSRCVQASEPVYPCFCIRSFRALARYSNHPAAGSSWRFRGLTMVFRLIQRVVMGVPEPQTGLLTRIITPSYCRFAAGQLWNCSRLTGSPCCSGPVLARTPSRTDATLPPFLQKGHRCGGEPAAGRRERPGRNSD